MSFRRGLTVVALAIVALVLVGQVRQLLADPTIWPPDDFVEYWAAAKLTLAGQNPFDPELLLPLQRAAGRQTDEAVMMWNPPWSLAIVLPLGLLPAREAQLLWLVVNLFAIGYSGDRLWLLLGGMREKRWMGWAIAIAALPTAFALQSGQISPLLLLGAVLFLECQRREWHFAAGAATVLLAIKPHLAYLVWLAILCDAVVRNRYWVVLGGAAAGLTCVAIALAFNPNVCHQYADALGNRPPAKWVSPTLGTLLRMAFGEESFRLQFVPVVVGLVWFAWYRWRFSVEGRTWDWCEQLPLLLLVSFATAPYGAWPFDMVLLIPAATWLMVHVGQQNALTHTLSITPSPPNPLSPGERGSRIYSPSPSGRGGWGVRANARLVIAGLVAVNLGCLALNLFHVTSFWFLWVSPVVLVLYQIGTRRSALAPAPTLFPSTNTRAAVPA